MTAGSVIPPPQRIAGHLARLGITREKPLLLGFSGGPDSVALALWLRATGFEKLTLVHLDHALRDSSARDSEWIKEFAERQGFGALCERVDVAALAALSGMGIEEAGREARYHLFAQKVFQTGVGRVLLGHQADDQVETFVFRLLRGSGSRGLGGMDYSSTRNVDGLTYTLLRPMLDVWREEILRFLKDTRTEYLEDASNQDPRWTRNRIRHALLPEMERVMDRSVRQVLWRTAEALREENAFLDAITEKFVTEKWLEVRELSFMQAAMQRRVVHRWLRLQRVPEISHAVVERVLGLVHSLRPAKVNLPGNRHARRRRGRIEVLQAVRLDSAD